MRGTYCASRLLHGTGGTMVGMWARGMFGIPCQLHMHKHMAVTFGLAWGATSGDLFALLACGERARPSPSERARPSEKRFSDDDRARASCTRGVFTHVLCSARVGTVVADDCWLC